MSAHHIISLPDDFGHHGDDLPGVLQTIGLLTHFLAQRRTHCPTPYVVVIRVASSLIYNLVPYKYRLVYVDTDNTIHEELILFFNHFFCQILY